MKKIDFVLPAKIRSFAKALPAFFIFAFSLSTAAAVPVPGMLEIYRPQNSANINDIPCLVRITDANGNDASDCVNGMTLSYYNELNQKHWNHPYWNGGFTGGSVIHLNIKKGIYKISVYTPKKYQGKFDNLTEGDWESNEFLYDTEAPALHVIFVSPVVNDNGFFTGRWHIDYKAPKFFKYTKGWQEEN